MNVGYLLGIDLHLPLWLILLITTILLYYIYMTWNNGIFKKMGIPGPTPLPVLGTLIPFFKMGFAGHDIHFAKKYGKLVGVFQGREPILLTQDPEIIKCILVKEFNNFVNREQDGVFNDEMAAHMLSISQEEIWRNLRNTISPTFSGGKLKKMIQHMIVTSNQMIHNLEEEALKGNTVEFESRTRSFAMDIIAGTAFGLQLDSQKDKENNFVKMANKGLDFSLANPVLVMMFFFPFLLKFTAKLGVTIFPKDSQEFFCKVIEQVMQDRQKNPKKHPDFIQLMMNTHKEKEYSEDQNSVSEVVGGRKALNKTEILANSVLFFLAGYDTTANTLAFATHLLAVNPECQEKLFQQIDEVLQGQEPTYDKLHDMPYLEQVLDETLRLYPQAPRLERIAKEAITINGVHIPKGMKVGIPVFVLHYDPDIWPEPEKFDPDRFTPENKASRDPYTYLPFGMGPRNCIGMRLAQMEIKIALIKLIQKYKFMQAPETQIPLKRQNMRMCSEKGVFLRIQHRLKTEA